MDNELFGMEPEVVRESIKRVQNAYEKILTLTTNGIKTKFIDEMSKIWGCNEAVNYFNNYFKPEINDLNNRIDSTFQSVIESMDSAAARWALETGEQYSSIRFWSIKTDVDVESISNKLPGGIGIRKDSALNTLEQLSVIQREAEADLSEAQVAVQDSGFRGGNQGESLYQKINSIKKNIEESFATISQEIRKYISDTVAAYGDLSAEISEKFTGE